MNEECKISDDTQSVMGKQAKSVLLPNCNMKIELFDKDGQVKDVRDIHNTVTSAGKNGLMDQVLATPTLAKPGWIELGTGSPAATLLGSYISGSRVAVTSKTRSENVITMIGDWAAGIGTGAITEAGVFDVATQNTANMWMSASFAVINKGADDTLRITWTLTGN